MSDYTSANATSTEEAMGLLLLCLSKQLDPCCLQQIALTSFKERGLLHPLFRAAMLGIASQWIEALVASKTVTSTTQVVPLTVQASVTPAPAAACSPNLAIFLYSLIGQGFGSKCGDYFFSRSSP